MSTIAGSNGGVRTYHDLDEVSPLAQLLSSSMQTLLHAIRDPPKTMRVTSAARILIIFGISQIPMASSLRDSMTRSEKPWSRIQTLCQSFLYCNTGTTTVSNGRESPLQHLIREIRLPKERSVGVLIHRCGKTIFARWCCEVDMAIDQTRNDELAVEVDDRELLILGPCEHFVARRGLRREFGHTVDVAIVDVDCDVGMDGAVFGIYMKNRMSAIQIHRVKENVLIESYQALGARSLLTYQARIDESVSLGRNRSPRFERSSGHSGVFEGVACQVGHQGILFLVLRWRWW